MRIIVQLKWLLRELDNGVQRWKINFKKCIQIGSHTQVRYSDIFSCVRVGKYCNIAGGTINSYTYLGDYCELPQTKIGKFCSIASHVTLAAGNHPMKYVSTSPYTYSKIPWSFTEEVLFKNEFYYINAKENYLCEIGNDVWIGTGALLVCSKDALHIGNGAVIAAGAVVTKDVPPYAVVAGCPAKIVHYRFDEDTIAKLLELEWWNKDEKWIKKNICLFESPEKFLKEFAGDNL